MKQETKEQKFKRLAEARTNRILHILRLLGNLSNKSTYNYDKKEVSRIFKAIEEEIENIKWKFQSSKPALFTLDAGVLQASGSKGIARRVLSKGTKSLHPPVKLDRCDNCFENRSLQTYRGLSLCKRDYRKRKMIYKIKKLNLAKGNGHSLVI